MDNFFINKNNTIYLILIAHKIIFIFNFFSNLILYFHQNLIYSLQILMNIKNYKIINGNNLANLFIYH